MRPRLSSIPPLAALGVLVVLGLDASALARQGPSIGYGAFKLSGVETDCVVPRLAREGRGAAIMVGPEGGEPLSDDEARAAHDCASPALSAAYARSGNVSAASYLDWANYSTAPYLSSTHGNRYVNNYANPIGGNYGQYEKGGELPVGTVLAKDSFVVNARGTVMIGALSLMEKMSPGFNPKFGDWRYTMILPDGTAIGTTGGAGAEKVAFCAGCHGTVDQIQDSLFFVPKRYRIEAR